MDLFDTVRTISKKAELLDSIQRLLFWDQETYISKEGGDFRSSQIELVANLIHEQKTLPAFKTALAALIDLETGNLTCAAETLDPWKKAALRLWQKEFVKDAKLPASFVEKFAKTASIAQQNWAKAKKADNFSLFAPDLEKIVALSREKAELIGYTGHPYNALLDGYEPGMSAEKLRPLFEKLKEHLVPLVKQHYRKDKHVVDCSFLFKDYDKEQQIAFSKMLMEKLGCKTTRFRLDESVHPFCMEIHPSDVRLTTHFVEQSLCPALFATLHELGHGLYHTALPEAYFGTPLCAATSLGIDESQSRLYETILGHSLPFWRHFYPLLQSYFLEQLDGISLEYFYKAIHAMPKTAIRIHSDELTYCLHIILRFEIELGLMDGSILVKDLPKIWNSKMQEYLDLTPQTDAEGVLQDIHWSMGGIGYFPTYALGNLYSAQIFETFKKEHPGYEKLFESGNFTALGTFLKEKIYQKGREFTADELIVQISGKELSIEPYISYLTEKYGKL